MDSAIEVRDLTKRYGEREVLKGISFRVPKGAISLYLGPNGAGKTTTFRLLAGLERPDGGEILFWDRPWNPEVKRTTGVTLEEPRFYPWLTGAENVEIVFRYRNVERPRRHALEALDRVGLGDAVHHRFGKYSLGMRQRLYMAAQLFPGVRAVLLDEPTNGLDVEGREQVWRMLMDLAKQGVSLFVSTHQVLEAERYAEYLVVLHEGRVAYQGRYRDLAMRRRVIVRATRPGDAMAALTRAGFRAYPGRREEEVYVEAPAEQLARVLEVLKAAGLHVFDGRLEDLEELYWRIKDDVQRTDQVEA